MITAYYYSIVHKVDNEIVDEGIIRDSEDTIYPRQNTGIKELPFECEAHHFTSPNYKLVGWDISLTRDKCRKFKSK